MTHTGHNAEGGVCVAAYIVCEVAIRPPWYKPTAPEQGLTTEQLPSYWQGICHNPKARNSTHAWRSETSARSNAWLKLTTQQTTVRPQPRLRGRTIQERSWSATKRLVRSGLACSTIARGGHCVRPRRWQGPTSLAPSCADLPQPRS